MRLAIAVACLLTLYGCATPEEIAARRAYEEELQRQQQATYAESLRRQCRSIGYQENTDAFRNCILQLHMANQQQNAQMRAVILQQLLLQQNQQNIRSMPYCSSLPPGIQGYQRAQGTCR